MRYRPYDEATTAQVPLSNLGTGGGLFGRQKD